jgi:hypothetical protein
MNFGGFEAACMGLPTPKTHDGLWIEMHSSVCVIPLAKKEVINLLKFSTLPSTDDDSIILHYITSVSM